MESFLIQKLHRIFFWRTITLIINLLKDAPQAFSCLLKSVKWINLAECLSTDKLNTLFNVTFFIASSYITEPPAELDSSKKIGKVTYWLLLVVSYKFCNGYPHVIINHFMINFPGMCKQFIVRFNECQSILMVTKIAVTLIALRWYENAQAKPLLFSGYF